MWEKNNCWSCRGDKFQSHVIIVPILRARPRASNAWTDTKPAMTTWTTRLNQNFLPFVVMVWTLTHVQWSLSYEHQHVSDEIEIQPGSSNPCLTSLFSPWYAPRISLDGDYAKSQFSAACIFCHRLNRTFVCQLYLRLISYQSLLVFCWSKPKLTVVSISSLEYLKEFFTLLEKVAWLGHHPLVGVHRDSKCLETQAVSKCPFQRESAGFVRASVR